MRQRLPAFRHRCDTATMKSPFGLLLKKRSSAGGEAKTPRDGSGGKQQPLFASAVERAASSSDAAMPAKPLASVAAPESKAAAAAAPSKPRALAKQESKPPVAVKHAKKLESLQALRYITALQVCIHCDCDCDCDGG